jgi:hypothetical protein
MSQPPRAWLCVCVCVWVTRTDGVVVRLVGWFDSLSNSPLSADGKKAEKTSKTKERGQTVKFTAQ